MKEDTTEPWVLPHFKACHGPCEQGRKPCPCPMACEEPTSDDGVEALGLIVMALLVIVFFAILGLGAVVGFVFRGA